MKKIRTFLIILTFFCITIFVLNAKASNETYNAIIYPAYIFDYTVVNVRADATTASDIKGVADMYTPVITTGEKDGFYSVKVRCSDGTVVYGYIKNDYIKPLTHTGTYYVCETQSGLYTPAPLLKYPSFNSDKTKSIDVYENVNGYFEVGGYRYVEYNGIYGFVQSSNLKPGFYKHSYTQNELKLAQKIADNSLIYKINSKKVIYNSKTYELDSYITLRDNLTMIPVKFLDDVFNAQLRWNDTEKSTEIIMNNKKTTIQIGSNIISIDGKKISFATQAAIINSRTYIPVKAVSQILGQNVYYTGNTNPIIISSENASIDIIKKSIEYINQKYKFKNSAHTLLWPVPSSNGISSCFYDGRNHMAIDITGEEKCEITASADGVVEYTNTDCTHNYSKYSNCCGDGYGNNIMIVHNETQDGLQVKTHYSHLTDVYVKKGDTVKAGQVIGTMGCTGYSTGVHLDYEVYKGLNRIDPGEMLIIPSTLRFTGTTSDCCEPYINNLLKNNG